MTSVVDHDEVLDVESAVALHLTFVFDTLYSLFSKEELHSVTRSLFIFELFNFVEICFVSKSSHESDLTSY